ncbi:MAG: peptidylprolyl isomerase [Clostridia bacterium]|nr:peptidylprolyl isomerase [Clostridia bacterium]
MAKQEKSAAELYREERKQRIAKAAKKNAKKSHNVTLSKKGKAAIAVILVLALVAGIGMMAVNLSGVLERGKNVMTVGETEVDKYEYSFYYLSTFNQYFNMSYSYDSYYGTGYGAMFTGYDYLTAPDEQAYSGEIEGVEEPTYADFFDLSAKQQIQYVEACKLYAAENGIELTEEDLADIDSQIEEYRTTAETIDYEGDKKYSLPAYLRENFGKGMTEELFTKIITDQQLVSKVNETKTEEIKNSYTEADIDKAFEDGITTYGVVTLRNYVISAEKVKTETTTESGTTEETEEVTEDTLAAAKAKADKFVAALTDEASFKNLAAEYEKLAGNEDYKEILTNDSVTLLEDAAYSDIAESDEDFFAWAFGKDTKVGSTYVTEDETSGYTVYMMVEPVHHAPDEVTYDVRHILLQFPEEETTEDSEEATEDTDTTEETTENSEDAKEEETVKAELLDTSAYDVNIDIDVDLEATEDPALYMEAQDILKKYLDGDKTEDAFSALAVEYSADSNAADGGIYEDVTVGYMVSEFESWALAKGREYGDVGIVETTYGYHIMYFIGTETTTWSDTIRTDKATEEFNTFAEEIIEEDNVAITVTDEAGIEQAAEFTLSKANQYIINAQSSAAAY